MKKKIIPLFLCVLCVFSLLVNSGCFSGVVGIYVETSPQKIVYNLHENINLKGICVKGINADGTQKKVRVNNNNIENDIDMTTFGEKTVVLNVDGKRTSFTIYIPHYSLTNNDDLKQTIQNANSGEIIHLKAGNYKNTEQNLEKYKDIIINKSLIFVGDKNQTIFSGNFILGIDNLENKNLINLNKVEFYNINFELNYTVNSGLITYEKPYFNSIVTAIDCNNTTGIYVKNCEFNGFSYAVKINDAKYLSVVKNTFKNVKICAIKSENSTQNTTVYKNVFMDICENTLYLKEGNKQEYMAAINFAFNSEENAGVIISNNSFTRIGLKNGEYECVNEISNNQKNNEKESYKKLSYINNTAIIILKSTNNANLKTRGIILSNNSYGTTLNNIIFGTREDDFLNESAVIINNN